MSLIDAFPVEHVEEIIYVGRRALLNAKDVDSIAARGFRSVIVLNERSASTTLNFADLFLSKHVQFISSNVPMTSLVELANSGHVEKFEQDFNEAKFDKLVSLLDVAPRPTLVVSFTPSSNQAALAVVYAYVATRQTKVHNVKKLTSDMRAFIEGYVETKLNRIVSFVCTKLFWRFCSGFRNFFHHFRKFMSTLTQKTDESCTSCEI